MNDREAAKELIKIAKQLEAYEFPNQKELIKYLHQHPAAKPRNHTVKRKPTRNRLPDQLRNPHKEKHEEYGKLEHADLDKDKVKKIRKRLKNLKERAKKVDDRNKEMKDNLKNKRPVKAPPVEEVTPKLKAPVEEGKPKAKGVDTSLTLAIKLIVCVELDGFIIFILI